MNLMEELFEDNASLKAKASKYISDWEDESDIEIDSLSKTTNQPRTSKDLTTVNNSTQITPSKPWRINTAVQTSFNDLSESSFSDEEIIEMQAHREVSSKRENSRVECLTPKGRHHLDLKPTQKSQRARNNKLTQCHKISKTTENITNEYKMTRSQIKVLPRKWSSCDAANRDSENSPAIPIENEVQNTAHKSNTQTYFVDNEILPVDSTETPIHKKISMKSHFESPLVEKETILQSRKNTTGKRLTYASTNNNTHKKLRTRNNVPEFINANKEDLENGEADVITVQSPQNNIKHVTATPKLSPLKKPRAATSQDSMRKSNMSHKKDKAAKKKKDNNHSPVLNTVRRSGRKRTPIKCTSLIIECRQQVIRKLAQHFDNYTIVKDLDIKSYEMENSRKLSASKPNISSNKKNLKRKRKH